MGNLFDGLKYFLEKIDHYRDELLFLFIKPYWPRKISPNQITWARIVIGLLLFILLFILNIDNKLLITSLFCMGLLTDLFDGSVARALDKATEFGAMLDHLADWILIIPIAVYSLYGFQKWLLLFLLIGEVINASVLIFHKSKNIPTKANIFGKTRMVLLSAVLIVILIVWPGQPPLIFIDIAWVSLIFTSLSVFIKLLELKNKGYVKFKNI